MALRRLVGARDLLLGPERERQALKYPEPTPEQREAMSRQLWAHLKDSPPPSFVCRQSPRWRREFALTLNSMGVPREWLKPNMKAAIRGEKAEDW
jgi:hypothetical protein